MTLDVKRAAETEPVGGVVTGVDAPDRTLPTDRFRLHRAGILNVWQYDSQEFAFADGRMLLRGANGAGKSKTLEMLLPFALDGDKARITASGRHHTSLLWLMTDGYEGQARVGYVWVEFRRPDPGGSGSGASEPGWRTFTCGVGIRASASTRSASAWHFTTSRRIGTDLSLEDDAGPLSRAALEAALGPDGHVFEKAAVYKEHIGRELFGLDAAQYDEVLRLLYWLRQPQIGEDIEPDKLALQLSQALPQLDEQAVRSAGDTFDELTAFGEQIERRQAAAAALEKWAQTYAAYAKAVTADRGRAVAEKLRDERRVRSELKRAEAEVAAADGELAEAKTALQHARHEIAQADARLRALEASPQARDQRRLADLNEAAQRDRTAARRAEERAARQEESHSRRAKAVARMTNEVTTTLTGFAQRIRDLDRRQRESVPSSTVPVTPALDSVDLAHASDAERVIEALDHGRSNLEAAHGSCVRRQGAVNAVKAALERVELAAAVQSRAQHAAEQAEQRWERARTLWRQAQAQVDQLIDEFEQALRSWAQSPGAPAISVPSEFTPQLLIDLPDLAHSAAAPDLDRFRAEQQRAATARDNAQRELARLNAERQAVEAERDPAPPPPALRRTERPDGQALWQVLDFAADVSDPDRARLEAALQASGLLDAWVRPGGRLLDPEHHDVVLQANRRSAPAAASLGQLLLVDVPPGSDVDAADVAALLASITVDQRPDSLACISPDGSWQLGPARGRSTKERAQFIGVTARRQERERRLAALDVAIDRAQAECDRAAAAFAELSERIATLESWQRQLPSGNELSRAWAQLPIRREAEQREAAENLAAQDAAHAARAATAHARDELNQLALTHGLPTDQQELVALGQRLNDLGVELKSAADQTRSIIRDLRRWIDDLADLDREASALAVEQAATREAEDLAERTRAEYGALRESVGASVLELERQVALVRDSRRVYAEVERRAEEQHTDLSRRIGRAEESVDTARQQLTLRVEQRQVVLAAFAELSGPPGLLEAAGGAETDQAELTRVAGQGDGIRIPPGVVAAADRIADLSTADSAAAKDRVWAAYNEASSGPAADHQPAVAGYGELLAVTGRDEAGEAAIVPLARRVGAGVERDRDLLSEREKRLFEQHVLGDLGDTIRHCRRDAAELVTAMDSLLGKVTTSQGIRVKLDWKLRDDVAPEACEAVRLLTQPVEALLPEERAKLRDCLHRLIEASRGERPELSYGEHLAAALDYRTWFQFTIRYTRPERPGVWEKLHRRSPLSQGEQKVLCYLPLFAAAAAHFTSLAGAAPYAPRLVLLDDAFPKIDVRTHPLLFGLLVQLDLDFLVTSERLWGDHDTVPCLSIYEALRDPSQRGIAQYEYRWDGHNLQSIG